MGFSLQPQPEPGAIANFQPYQIVCLEFEANYLYAEVIQIIEPRQICWARPLVLKVDSKTPLLQFSSSDLNEPVLYDLRYSSDLLLPVALFRTALDVEVIGLLPQLYEPTPAQNELKGTKTARLQLNQLVRQLCQAFPDAFRA